MNKNSELSETTIRMIVVIGLILLALTIIGSKAMNFTQMLGN